MNFTTEGKIKAYCREHNREKIVIRQERRGDYFVKVRYEVCCDPGLFASPYVKETILDDPISWTKLLERTVISVRKTTIDNKRVMEGLIRSLQAQYPEQFGKAKQQIFDAKRTEAAARAKNILQRAGLKQAQYLKRELALRAKGVVEKGVKSLIDRGVDDILLNDLRTLQVTTGILPNKNGCIQYKKVGNREIYVMQYEPMIRTIFLEYDLTTKVGDRPKPEGYRLSFPWVVFVVVTSSGRYEQMHCFMTPKRIVTENQALCEPLLPNVWLSTENKLQNTFSHVCTGNMDLSGSVIEKVEQAINKFWQSNFNADLSGALIDKMKIYPEIRSFSTWEENSKKSPGFVLRMPYKELITLERFLSRWNANVGNNGEDIVKGLKKSLKENASELETTLVDFLADTIIPISDVALTEDFKAELEKIDAELAQIASATAEQLMTDKNLENTSWGAMEELIDASVHSVFDDLLKQIGIK